MQLDRLARSREPFAVAAAAFRTVAAGRPCLVFSTEVPMTVWYTGCRAIQVDGWINVRRAVNDGPIYLLEAAGLPRSIGDVATSTRAELGWTPIACSETARFCVWRASATTSRNRDVTGPPRPQ
jgi:hypothetical protein